MKTIFMGTPEIAATVLEALLSSKLIPSIVVTQTAKAKGRGQKVAVSPVEALATARGIPVIATDAISQSPDFEKIQSLEPDLILVAAFGQILRENVLNLPKIACLNVHASLLPKYRGAAPIQRAVWDGLKETGITIQKMAKKLDTGDILLQKKLPIYENETSGELTARLAILGGEALIEAVQSITSGKYTFTPQNETEATHAKKLDKNDSLIIWQKSALEIHNQVRALQPWPVAESILETTKIKIYKTEPLSEKSSKEPGAIESDGKTFLKITCGSQTVLSLLEVQLENRKRVSIKDFLNSYRGNFPFKKFGA